MKISVKPFDLPQPYEETFEFLIQQERLHLCVLEQAELEQIINNEYYQAVVSIRDILRDEKLSDKRCYRKIEEIIRVTETLGLDCGHRHVY